LLDFGLNGKSQFTDKDKQRSPLPFLTRKKRSPLTDKDKQRSPLTVKKKSDRLLRIKKNRDRFPINALRQMFNKLNRCFFSFSPKVTLDILLYGG
jgi:hypothetical protein